jgi:ABC-type oligopeptide transport system substrate-binding subunit
VPKFGKYNNSAVDGFDFSPDEAKKLMSAAGYPNGKGFPELTLYLNEGGSINTIIAAAIQNQLKENIGVSIKIEPLPFDVLIERFATGQTDFTRTSWIADFPDASNFLWLFYGKNVPNDPNARSLPNFLIAFSCSSSQASLNLIKKVEGKQNREVWPGQLDHEECWLIPIARIQCLAAKLSFSTPTGILLVGADS